MQKKIKKIILAAISFLFGVSTLNAQHENCLTVYKTYPNTTNRSIFQNYPDIDSIWIKLVQEKPTDLQLYNKPGAVFSKLWYNWEFEGDLYLFKKEFPKADLPVLPKAEIDYMAGLNKCKIPSDYFLNAVVYRDSVKYKFSQCCSTDSDWVFVGRLDRPGACYNGDLRKLAKLFEQQYDNKKHKPAGDSVLIFQAVVGKQNLNNLQDLTLKTGTKSAFSDFIQQGLEETGASWLPAFQGGHQVKYYIRVYARLNSDGSITLSTS